jgi:uncharacterized coiled-coil protein SlyX
LRKSDRIRSLEIKVARLEVIISTLETFIIASGNQSKVESLDAGKWYKPGEDKPQ